MRRAALILAAPLALLLAACGGAGGNGTTATESPTTAAEAPTTAVESAPTTTESTTTEDEGVVEAEIAIEGGEPAGGVQDIEVESGKHVAIRITSDAPDEVHFHGYDIEAAVAPGEPAEVDFVADLEGIFDIESHETETLLARLVVEP